MNRTASIVVAILSQSTAAAAFQTESVPAGNYVRVEDAFSQELLTIEANGRYELVAMADAGAYRISNQLRRVGARLVLAEPGPRLVIVLRVVSWGSDVFLVEPGDFETFCGFAERAAGQRRSAAPLPPCIFGPSAPSTAIYPARQPPACSQTRGCRLPSPDAEIEDLSDPNLEGVVVSLEGDTLQIGVPSGPDMTVTLTGTSDIFTVFGGLIGRREIEAGDPVRVWYERCQEPSRGNDAKAAVVLFGPLQPSDPWPAEE